MPTVKRIEAIGAIIKALAALFALMPGIAVLTGLIDIPPTLVQLVQALSFFISAAVLIGIMLASARIRRIPSGTVAGLAVAAVLAGSAAAVGYWRFAETHIVIVQSHSGDGEAETRRHVVPLRPSAEVASLVGPYRGDYAEALETSNQRIRLAQRLEEESGGSAAVMIALLVLAQTLLVAGVAAGAWRLAMTDEEEQGRSGSGPARAPSAVAS